MPRKRTISDDVLLDAALAVVRSSGPDGLSFGVLAPLVGLAPSTVVQRFGSKAGLLQATLLRAWDHLDADTAAADAAAPVDPAGAVELLVRLSGQYDEHGDLADQLLVLREDLRDPVLRARGAAWIATLGAAVERRLPAAPGGPSGWGRLLVTQWQGALTVWSFTRDGPLPDAIRAALTELVDRAARGDGEPGPAVPARRRRRG
jgi:AcrR family transcriptional regulator